MNDKIYELFSLLHSIPEPSGHELKTQAALKKFLIENTTLELSDPCEGSCGFYASHREGADRSIAFRADFDALPLQNGRYAHLCGHDGHAAALCALALELEGKRLGKNVHLIFQPAEETGMGAKECVGIIEREGISEIYGAHNLPGFEFGRVFTRPETFACASQGFIISFSGSAAHAAYPELGNSPAAALAELLSIAAFPSLSSRGMTLCTIVSVKMGDENFGISPADAKLCLTLRAEFDSDLKALKGLLTEKAESLAKKYSLDLSFEDRDVFPSTENDPTLAKNVLKKTNGALLELPMRWSEDFGEYLKLCSGVFFGIGAGTDCPPLHAHDYSYPTALLEPTVNAFLKLIG